MLRPVNICFHNCSKRLLHGQKRDPFSVLDLESCASFEQVKVYVVSVTQYIHVPTLLPVLAKIFVACQTVAS
jgi:hypothetical protein